MGFFDCKGARGRVAGLGREVMHARWTGDWTVGAVKDCAGLCERKGRERRGNGKGWREGGGGEGERICFGGRSTRSGG